MDFEKLYRQLLWESHAGYTHLNSLYGDDGEMQCNHRDCMIDFKRDPIDQIHHEIFIMNAKRVSESLKVLDYNE